MGETIQETSNGQIIRAENGKFLPGTKPANMITAENARLMHERRREKAAALLRSKISAATLGADICNKPLEAVARVGAQIWAEVAANSEANPRYRLEAWQAIGKHAGILGNPDKDDANQQQTAQTAATIGASVAMSMLAEIYKHRNDK